MDLLISLKYVNERRFHFRNQRYNSKSPNMTRLCEEWNVLDIPSQFICNGTHCEIHFKYSIFSVY